MADEPIKFENNAMYDLNKMGPQEVFEFNRAMDIEAEIRDNLDPYARFTESMFRRQALPILSGLLDGSFDDNAYINCIGSAMVPLQVVQDEDPTKLMFTIPPLFFTGQSLLHVEGQQSLTDEALEISSRAEILPILGPRAKHDLIVNTLDGIEMASYETNRRRAKQTIDLLNWVFKRYKLNGQIAYPAGMEDLIQADGKSAAPAAVVQRQPIISDDGIEDGEDL